MENNKNINFKSLYQVETLDEYIKFYEWKFGVSIDMSPGQIQRNTEKRIIKELKKLNSIIKGD